MSRLTFTFRGVHSDALGIYPTKKDTGLLPELSKNLQEVSGRDGAIDFGNNFYKMREITIDFLFITSSAQEREKRKRILANWFSEKGELIFSDEPDKRWIGRVYNALPLTEVGYAEEFSATFTCDPYAYALDETIINATGNTPIIIPIKRQGTANRVSCKIIIRNNGSQPLKNIRIINKKRKDKEFTW